MMLMASLVLLLSAVVRSPGSEWKEIKGTHFIVEYKGSSAFARKVSYSAEKSYKQITLDLGYTKHDNFWLWEDRARIRIHATRKEFRESAKAPSWAVGKADYVSKQISTFGDSKEFLSSVLHHEMAHLIFRDFVGFKKNVPLWLDEGVAQWEDVASRDRSSKLVQKMCLENRLKPLSVLMVLDVRGEKDTRKAMEFYAQSVSIVSYLIEKKGAERFTIFCRKLRDGKNVDEALGFTYPAGTGNLEGLERAWKSHLKEKANSDKSAE
jgi:hypothetical protein